jgi:hypothetical protein
MKSLIGLCLLASVGCIEDVVDGYPTGADKTWLGHHFGLKKDRILNVVDGEVADMDSLMQSELVWRFLGTRDDPDAQREVVSGAIKLTFRNTFNRSVAVVLKEYQFQDSENLPVATIPVVEDDDSSRVESLRGSAVLIVGAFRDKVFKHKFKLSLLNLDEVKSISGMKIPRGYFFWDDPMPPSDEIINSPPYDIAMDTKIDMVMLRRMLDAHTPPGEGDAE